MASVGFSAVTVSVTALIPSGTRGSWAKASSCWKVRDQPVVERGRALECGRADDERVGERRRREAQGGDPGAQVVEQSGAVVEERAAAAGP